MQGNEIKIGRCDFCGKRTITAEIILTRSTFNHTIINICRSCLGNAIGRIKQKEQGIKQPREAVRQT